MPAKEAPIGLALLVCDTVIEDRYTGKRTLVGIFNRLGASRYPCVHPQMGLYVSLTSGRGVYDCAVHCRHVESGHTVFRSGGEVRCRDPLQVVELIFTLANVRFPESGPYWVEFLVDGVPLMMRRLFLDVLRDDEPPRPPEARGDEERN